MPARVAGFAIGTVFGVMLVWSGMTSPAVIREALLFQDGYLFAFMFSAMATATLGQALLRRSGRRAALTGAPIAWTTERPQRRHIVGSLVFGLGWGLSNVCPGPIATQLGQGIGWSLFTLAGLVLGVRYYQRGATLETEPAADPAPATAAVTGAA